MVDKGLQRVGGRGFLDNSDEDDDLYTIHGIAIGAGDITLGSKSGERKYWTEDVLQDGASTLEGKQIVANHENRDIYSVVGKVTDASYSEEKNGVIYQGVVDEELIAKRISRGWLDVSPRIIHTEGEVTENGLKKPDKIRRFDNLAIVSRGAAPSNEVDSGESEELDVEELQACFDKGPNFEEGELETFTEELQDNINYKQYLYNSPEAAEGAAQGLNCEGFHKHGIDGGTWYMPCENHDDFLANVKTKSEELQLSEARNPEYDGTEESSWGDVSKDLTDWVDALGYDDVETVSDLTESQKQEVANHTLLGDSESDTWQALSYFPVVNPNTGNLNRGALEAVRSGRGQAADIPESTYESAFTIAGRLLNEEFDSDVEVEMSAESLYESVVIEELQEDLDEVYSEWSDTVNMTASELRRWSGNPCSREASLDPTEVIERNLNLLETNKSDWGEDEIEDANRTISFINRMKPNSPDGDASDGANGCPTEWAISLLNWAYNPFDDLPGQPDDEDLDDVEELETLGISEGDMVQWRIKPDLMGKVVAIDEQRDVAMVSIYKEGEDTNVAITAAFEDIIPVEVEEMAQNDFTKGDYVTWDNGSAHGKIVDTTTSGTYDSEIDGDVTVSGTEDDPAALIDIYQDVDGSWQKGEKTVAHKFSTLNNWDVNTDELSKHMEEASNYSSEEMRIASQLSSYSEATKTQCLRVVDLMNPERKTDVYSFMDVLSKVMREQEMERMYEEMKKVNGDGIDEDEDSGESPLNKIFN
jgi:hypothetical protein